MELLRILYWGVAYTTGIACATAFFLRYALKREILSLKLALFLLAFGASVVCLSIRELYIDSYLGSVAGCLALSGASLIIVTFPDYALGFDMVKRRRAMATAFKTAGFALAVLNPASLFVRFPLWYILYALTLSLLGLSIFIGMSWISRGSVQWDSHQKPFWMASLFAFFSLVVVLDFFRGLIPALGRLSRNYWVLPAFYAYLNVFLIYNHVTTWAKAALENESGGKEARAELLDRFGVSKREAEVLALLRRGRTYLEMADSLCVSLATIKSHVSHLYEKTATRNKVELINLLYDSAE